jgi:Zn-dependent M28 family amino/carboxypeptidase
MSGALGGIIGRAPASLLIASDAPEEQWVAEARGALARTSDVLGEIPRTGLPILMVRDASLARVLGPLGLDVPAIRARAAGPAMAVPVDGLSLTVTQRVRVVAEVAAPNVVAILEGSDPVLRGEYVAFSGHMDHVGVRPGQGADSIFNGADDDASGTTLVMEVAEAMASMETAPRRSMLFVVVSGEERGLWGSRYFADNPTVPIQNIVANLNADMVGRNWPDTIVAIGMGHSDLGSTMERVNAARPDLGMTAIDDRWPEENFYGRSDHINFARKGVPILFFFNGTHEDYHRPSDELDRIDTDKAARIGRLVYYLGVEIGNADPRPQWNEDSYRTIVGGGR